MEDRFYALNLEVMLLRNALSLSLKQENEGGMVPYQESGDCSMKDKLQQEEGAFPPGASHPHIHHPLKIDIGPTHSPYHYYYLIVYSNLPKGSF